MQIVPTSAATTPSLSLKQYPKNSLNNNFVAKTILGFIILAFGVLMIAGTYGLWTIQPWGRKFNIWLEIASIPFSLLTLIGIAPGGKVTASDRITAVIGILIAVAIIRYLNSDSIKRLYEGDAIDDWKPAEPR